MRLSSGPGPLILATLCCIPTTALAHSFGRIYNLPVPFWLYAWGSAAALLASFLIVGFFITAKDQGQGPRKREVTNTTLLHFARRWHVLSLLKIISVGGLLLCIATGFWGVKSPYGNFNMTFFWIIFILGFAYLTALVGDIYALVNPWRVLAESLQRIVARFGVGLVRYPQRLGVWPALLLYMAFIWIELFGRTTPYSLGVMLSVYSLINLLGVGLIGMRDWFRYCEFLGVFFRLIAILAPVEIVRAASESERSRIYLRMPFSGPLDTPVKETGMVLFVLFMLSSTAFDGLRETIVWQRIYWVDLYSWKIQALVGSNPLSAFPLASKIFLGWSTLWLMLSPLLYFVIYLLFIWLIRLVTQARMPLSELTRAFAYSLLPIVLVYNVTHYYTLIQSQGVKIISLMSDPFGWGWNIFGTAKWLQRTFIPDAGTVWHVQVGLIVLGHIVSVYVAHLVALRIFPTHRQAVISQIPMLFLMVIFTVVGLWILSQPVRTGG